MSIKIGWTVTGTKEVLNRFATLKTGAQSRIAQRAMRSALPILVRSIRSRIPPRLSTTKYGKKGERNRTIEYSISFIAKTRDKRGNLAISKVGASIGRTYPRNMNPPPSKDRAIGRLAYFTGTRPRYTKLGKYRGMVLGNTAVSVGVWAARGAFSNQFNAEVERLTLKEWNKQVAGSTVTLKT